MNSKVMAGLAIVLVIIIAGVFIVIRSRGRVGPGPNDSITAAAGDDAGAKSVTETQFRQDYPNTPTGAAVSVELNDVSSEYWKATATCGSDSKTYWVPKLRPKESRMQVGQSLTYAVTMASTSGTMNASFAYAVTEQTTYEGIPCYKIQISGNATAMDMNVPYSGYSYIGQADYRPRYMNVSMTTTAMGQTLTETIEYFYNYNTNKLRTKITINGQVYSDNETDLSQNTFSEYNPQGFLGENLHVGWSENFSYQSDNTKYAMTLTVTKEETITVPAGTFRCYVLSATMPEIEEMAGVDLTCNIWVNAQMTLVPKLEISASYSGQTALSMTMTLQDYSGY